MLDLINNVYLAAGLLKQERPFDTKCISGNSCFPRLSSNHVILFAATKLG